MRHRTGFPELAAFHSMEILAQQGQGFLGLSPVGTCAPLGVCCGASACIFPRAEQEPKGAEAADSVPGGQQCTGQLHRDAAFSPGAPEVAS